MKKLDINKAHDLYHVTVRMTKLCGSCGSSLELLDESLDKSLAQIFYWLCRLQSRQPSISFSLSNAVFFFYFIPFFLLALLLYCVSVYYFDSFFLLLCLPFLACLVFLFCLKFWFTCSPLSFFLSSFSLLVLFL